MECGTRRWVKLRTLRRDGIACRWCHGWRKWLPWSEEARERASRWRAISTSPEESVRKLWLVGLVPLTPPGDEFTPVGFVCPACGETGVTVPERIGDGERGYFGCPRCAQDRKRRVREDAPELFAANGLRLLGPCRGEYAPQAAECVTCGTERHVSYAELRDGTAPLCWTCTHGIRPDEPHRVYLVHFPALAVMKVGLTHDRHDRRLLEHQLQGGDTLATVVVPDRSTARRVERYVRAQYAPWTTVEVGPEEFPQGGWTETWTDDAPPLNLRAAAREIEAADID